MPDPELRITPINGGFQVGRGIIVATCDEAMQIVRLRRFWRRCDRAMIQLYVRIAEIERNETQKNETICDKVGKAPFDDGQYPIRLYEITAHYPFAFSAALRTLHVLEIRTSQDLDRTLAFLTPLISDLSGFTTLSLQRASDSIPTIYIRSGNVFVVSPTSSKSGNL